VFLNEALCCLTRWKDPRTYSNECGSSPGFKVNFNKQEGPNATHSEFLSCMKTWAKSMAKVRKKDRDILY
jgi:hypothetical protein